MRRFPAGIPPTHRTGLLPLALGSAFACILGTYPDIARSESLQPVNGVQGSPIETVGSPVQTQYLRILWPMPPARDPESDQVNAVNAAEACKQLGHSFLVAQGLWGTGLFDDYGCYTAVGQRFFGGREAKSDSVWSLEFGQNTDKLTLRMMFAPDKVTNSAAVALISPPMEAGAVTYATTPNWQYLMRDEFYSKLVATAVMDTMPASVRLPLTAAALKSDDASQLGRTAAPSALQLFTWGVQPETGLWTAHVVGQARVEAGDKVVEWTDRNSINRETVVYAQRRGGPEQGAQALLLSIRYRGQTITDGADEPRPGKLYAVQPVETVRPIDPQRPQTPAPLREPAVSGEPLQLAPPVPATQNAPAAQPIEPIQQPPRVEAPPEPIQPIQPSAPMPAIEAIQPPAPAQAPEPMQAPASIAAAPAEYEPPRPRKPGSSDNFVALRYGIEMIDTATALFSPGTVMTLIGEFHQSWFDGFRFYSDILPDHQRDIEGEVFSMGWTRTVIGWGFNYKLVGLIDRLELTPKLGRWSVKSRLPDVDTQGNIVTRDYSASGLTNVGIDIGGVIENVNYAARLWHGRDMTLSMGKSSGEAKRELQGSRTGLEVTIKGPALRFISNNAHVNILVFDYFEDMTFSETGGTSSNIKFVYSTAFAGGGVSLSW